MKNRFLPILCVVLFQCFPEKSTYDESFVNLKKEETKTSTIFSCSIQPIDNDTDLSHYKIFGVALKGNVEHGKLKVAYKKQGSRLNYEVPLTPDEAVSLDKVYMTEKDKDKFHNGKICSFRILFDDSEVIPRFMLRDSVLSKYSGNNIGAVDDEKVKISIFVEHKNAEKVDKASDEIVF